MSSRLVFTPERANASLATSSMRSRLRCASARGCRVGAAVFELFLSMTNLFATGESLRLSDALYTETDSVLLDAAGTRQSISVFASCTRRQSFAEFIFKQRDHDGS